MIVFLVLSFGFSTVLSVGAADTIRVSNAVTFLQSETVEYGRYKPILNDYGFVNLETRTRLRRQTNVLTPLNDKDIEEILYIHNAFRRLEPASDMQYMTWNSYLADMATEWSSTCIWGHGQPERKPSSSRPFNPLGQNLYLTAAASLNITFLVWRWYSEKPDYNYAAATCEAEMCGHYTQVVWSQSREVGCGKYLCPKAVDKKTKEIYSNVWIFACNYGPAGNINGMRPYTLGEPCTACISGQMWCDREEPRGLCRRDCNQTSDTCECKASCKNQGVVNLSNHSCSCECTNGWGDGDCGKSCCDYNSSCGNNWPKSACYNRNFGDLIRSFCLKTCGLCTDATPTEQASCPVFTTTYQKTTAYNDNSTYFNITFVPVSSTPASSISALSMITSIPSSPTTMSTTISITTKPMSTSAVPIATSPMTTSTTTPIPKNPVTTSTTTPIPFTTSTATTILTNPTTTSTTTTIPIIPVTTSTSTSTTTPVSTNPVTTSTTTSSTTPISTNPVTTSTTPIPTIPVTTSTTTSSTTPVSTNLVTTSTVTSTTTPIPIIPVTTTTTTSSSRPISTNLVTTSTATSTTTQIPIIPVNTTTTTSSSRPFSTNPVTTSTTTSTTTPIPISSTTTSTTNSRPVSRLYPTASLGSGPNDATTSAGGFTGSESPSQMLWMIVIVSTLGAVIVLVIVIVIILLLLWQSRIKKQSHRLGESSRPHEISRSTAMYNASAPPPVNPFFHEEVVALDDIKGHFTEDIAKAFPPNPAGSFQENISTYR